MQDDAAPGLAQDTRVVQVVESVRSSTKYAGIAPDLVMAIAAQELAKGARVKDAVKQVKNRLHQGVAAYWTERADFAAWRALLDAADGDAELRDALLYIMRAHHSTRERLPILADFYRTVLAGVGPIRSVLDLGCGLNPLALPWMNLGPESAYFACDVDAGQVTFLADWLARCNRRGAAFICDLLHAAPSQDELAAQLPDGFCSGVDVVLMLKTIPCLEQLDKDIGPRLFDSVTAPVLIVSFPAQSLGGRRKGMVEHYAAHMDKLSAGRGWAVERFEFPSELVFRVQRGMV